MTYRVSRWLFPSRYPAGRRPPIRLRSQVFILRELARYFNEYEALHGIRSRRSGSRVFVEIFLEFAAEKTVGEVQEVVNRLRRNIEAAIQGSRVTIALATEPVE